MKYLVLFLLFLPACGIGIHVDPITTKPLQVVHTIGVNFDSVFNYCTQQCETQTTDQTQIQTCANQCYTNFVNVLAHAIESSGLIPSPSATPTPTPTPSI